MFVLLSNVTRLQFRLPDGSATSNQFSADAKFLAVEEFVTQVTDSFYLSGDKKILFYVKR